MQKIKFKFLEGCQFIYFDTEQSRGDVQKIGRRILALTEKKQLDNLTIYSLRGLSPVDKRFLILNTVLQRKTPLIIIIDNVRDLQYNINDQTEAHNTMLLIQELGDLGHHIILVLHATRGGDQAARGAIGTECMNRAETVIEIIKQDNISVVRAFLTREKSFEDFAIKLNEANLPEIVQDWIKTTRKVIGRGKKTTNPQEIKESDHKSVLSLFMLKDEKPI